MYIDASAKKPSIVPVVVGAIVFGAVIPVVSWLLWLWIELPSGPHWGLGLAFAAYVFHSAGLRGRQRGHFQLFCVIMIALVGLTYGAWAESAQSFVEMFTNRFETRPPPGVPGGYAVGTTVTPVVTGALMALLLLVATRSVSVALATLIASIVCGLLVLPTWGGSSVLWNVVVATALYRWSWLFPHPTLCRACGFDLSGSMSGVCSECGRAVGV
jgi:hypothetical protein